LNSRIQTCYRAPIIWVFALKNRETERVALATVMLWCSRRSETEQISMRQRLPFEDWSQQ
jgi:hypothetical protein